jgi:hypothetical protein
VTLRLAGLLAGTVDGSGLTDAARDRAQFSDADSIVAELTSRGLLDDGRLTGAGRELVEQIQATVTEATRPVWQGCPRTTRPPRRAYSTRSWHAPGPC